MEAAPRTPTFRAARVEDAKALADLWTAAYVTSGQAPEMQPYTEDGVEGLLGAATGQVAELDGRVVGAVVLAQHGAAQAVLTVSIDEAILLRLAVDEQARGHGVGRALVDWCVSEARARGVSRLWLWTRPVQQSAHRIYESIGFERRPERDEEAGPPGRLVYVLELSAD
jgi:ribosomal protein S18 acetylase RimI-like enzyme